MANSEQVSIYTTPPTATGKQQFVVNNPGQVVLNGVTMPSYPTPSNVTLTYKLQVQSSGVVGWVQG